MNLSEAVRSSLTVSIFLGVFGTFVMCRIVISFLDRVMVSRSKFPTPLYVCIHVTALVFLATVQAALMFSLELEGLLLFSSFGALAVVGGRSSRYSSMPYSRIRDIGKDIVTYTPKMTLKAMSAYIAILLGLIIFYVGPIVLILSKV
jgi:L-asparagine transporter-like permease